MKTNNKMDGVAITPIKALKDNYIWMIREGQRAWIVDPGEAGPVWEHLDQENLVLAGILITHHHPDHTAGVEALKLKQGKIPVYAGPRSAVASITQRVAEGEELAIGGLLLKAIEIPGHTLDHTAFYGVVEGRPTLFSGDTLFSGGCGRLFEGTPEQMFHSLGKLALLPDETQIYCGHEYTLANLRFAEAVEPGNEKIRRKISTTREKMEAEGCSLPSTIGEEKGFNPFLRCHSPEVKSSAEKFAGKKLHHPGEVFAALRAWKNDFR